jgi:acyl dehydratase
VTVNKIATLKEFAQLVGTDVGVSDWHTVDQAQITAFGETTRDRQWIHVDPERAKDGPFGSTIAHGFLTLSMLTYLLDSCVVLEEVSSGINLGFNKVRFTNAVRANSRIRGRFKLADCRSIDRGGVRAAWAVSIEIEGASRAACTAEWLTNYYPAQPAS